MSHSTVAIFFIHSSVHGYSGCFHVLAIVNRAEMNIGVHVSFWIMVFSGYMPRIGIAGSYGSSTLSNGYCGRAGGMNGQNTGERGFLCQWNYSTWQWWWIQVIIHLSEPLECTTPGVDPNTTVDSGCLWCTGISLSMVTNVPLWLGDVDNARGCVCEEGAGREMYANSLYLPLNFVVNLKNCSEKIMYLKKDHVRATQLGWAGHMANTWQLPIFKLKYTILFLVKMLFRWKRKLQWEIVADKGKESFGVISLIIGGNFVKCRHCRIPMHPPHHQQVSKESFYEAKAWASLPFPARRNDGALHGHQAYCSQETCLFHP